MASPVADRPPGSGRRCATFAALVACAASAAFAGGGERRFETVGLAAGLSNLAVTALAQDRDGFVWIGTEEGLNRFDGLAMRVFRHRPGDSTSLGSNRIAALLVAADGTLWVGTRGGGLARYDAETERFENFRHDPARPDSLAQNDLSALAEDRRGRLWVGTVRAGVDRLDATVAGGRFVHHRHDEARAESLGDDRVRALALDRGDRLWVGTLGGLHRLDAEDPPRFSRFLHDPARPEALADDEIWALALDRAGALWIGSWGGGVDRLDELEATPAAARFVALAPRAGEPGALPDPRLAAIHQDAAGTLWFGTRTAGLVELTAAARREERPALRLHRHDPAWPFSLAGDQITALLEDRAGDLWIGTGGAGVSRLDRRHETNRYDRHIPGDPSSLPPGGVRRMLVDANGALWVAVGDELARLDPAPERAIVRVEGPSGAASSPFGSIYDLAQEGTGDLWIASAKHGLFRLPAAEVAASSPRFERRAAGPGESMDAVALPTNAALSLLVDRAGRLWIGTYRGLHRAERDAAGRIVALTSFRHDPDDPATLSSDRVGVLAEGPDGAIWAGCYFGLNRIDPASGEVRRFLPDPTSAGTLSYEHVLALHFDRAGTLWVGTFGGGLDRFDPASGRFAVIGVAEGLPSETVAAIVSDDGGALWLATARGLARYSPESGRVETFGVNDGLLDESLEDVALDGAGRLLIASGEGLVSMARPSIGAPGAGPPVRLTGLFRLNEQVAVGGADGLLSRALSRTRRVTLGPAARQFSIEFAALAFRDPARHRYRYRLAEHDVEWNESSGDDRRAVYSRVAPGSYRFEVVAADESGRWSDPGATVEVVVLPPWWASWWARGGAAFLVLGGAFAGYRARVGRLRRAAVVLERKVEERTAELAEANRRLEHASRTDLLTGLPNRRHFLERAESERVATKRSERPFSILLGDIDRFKSTNDTYGHEGGDRVLAAVGSTLRDAVRERDLPARWGGEEFIVLLPETGLGGARMLAEKIRRTLESLRVLVESGEIPVTMTIGVAELAPGERIDALVARADAALYAGKASGRNRVEVAPPPSG